MRASLRLAILFTFALAAATPAAQAQRAPRATPTQRAAGAAASQGILGTPATANRAVYLDSAGVVRWSDDRQEVSLFGSNYVIHTASDYRAAGYVHGDRKRMIDEDVAQFARMGWDGLRHEIGRAHV